VRAQPTICLPELRHHSFNISAAASADRHDRETCQEPGRARWRVAELRSAYWAAEAPEASGRDERCENVAAHLALDSRGSPLGLGYHARAVIALTRP